jgi:hypothetical protein
MVRTTTFRSSEMELNGALCNLDLASFQRLDRLRAKLAAGAPADWVPTPLVDKRTQRGWVLAAVRQVLAEAQEPTRMCEIIAKVEAMLGKPVTKSSVENCLCSYVSGKHLDLSGWGEGGIRSGWKTLPSFDPCSLHHLTKVEPAQSPRGLGLWRLLGTRIASDG